MKTIETSKCKFHVKDIPSLDLVYNDKLNDYLLSLERIKLSEITELQAIGIVDEPLFGLHYIDYRYKYGCNSYAGIYRLLNPIDSLNTLLESHNIEITNNTYIFKA